MTAKERIAYLLVLNATKLARLAEMPPPRPVIAREYPTLALVRVGAYEQPMLQRAG